MFMYCGGRVSRRNLVLASSSPIISFRAFRNFYLVNAPVDKVAALKSLFLPNSVICSIP